jgi:Ring finger domain
MATASPTVDSTNVRGSKAAVPVCMSVGLVGIIIIVGWLVHRRAPTIIVPTSAVYPGTRRELGRKDIASYILKSIPVVRYNAMQQLNDLEQATGPGDSAIHTYPLGKEVPTMADSDKSTHACPKAAVIARADEPREGRIIKDPGTSGYNIEMPLVANASQTTKRSESYQKPLSCPVCVEDFLESDNVRILPCGHAYHQHCIDLWLLGFAGTCPLW